MYPLTQDEKDWLQELINLLPDGQLKTEAQFWLDHAPATVSDSQLNTAVNYFLNNFFYSQVQEWSAWVKGGDRPPHPHG